MDLSKLGITPGPWERWPEYKYNDYFDDEIEKTAGMVVAKTKDDPWTLATICRGQPGEEKDGDVIAASYEMLEALIRIGIDSENGGLIDWLNFKDYFMPIIEKATGLSWEQVKKKLNIEE